uniref:Homeobox domain-containing protein n=1 Tax=Coccidioides posadasii RMSCC 3488 TaxID=454284 RepID=A0A0J6FMG2_COCPO|nr:hypothetical protein CPAG_07879 [Coccidioides posadasii RMSCC 3488]
MDYIHTPFPCGEHNVGPFIDPSVGYGVPASFTQCNPPTEPCFVSYSPSEFPGFPGFYGHPVPFEDYHEYVENLSRPRLTKEQVETLEAQFRAQPKPTSNVKRQLAMQTNLTLPRVANWFQNRRAKEKQQKRQEEFKRMQAMKSSENLKREEISSSTDARRTQYADKVSGPDHMPGQNQVVSTPNDGNSNAEPLGNQSNSSHPPVKEVVSLPPSRKLDPRGPHETSTTKTVDVAEEPQSREKNALPEKSNDGLTADKLESSAWSISSQLNNALCTEPIDAPNVNSSQPPTEFRSAELWQQESDAGNKPIFCVSYSTCEAHSGLSKGRSYPNDEPVMQTFPHTAILDFGATDIRVQRQESCPSCPQKYSSQRNLVQNMTIAERSIEKELQDPQVSPPDGTIFPRRRDKKLDLAARRKRPRPAAIGIGGPSQALVGPSSMSPTTRTPTWAVSHSLRHVKSSHNLSSSLSPRYGGIRKVSAPLRSPLGMRASLDISGASCSNSDFMVPPLVATSMAPPTPLTPDDLQYLVPPTPNDAQYCLSPTDEMRCPQPFPLSHSIDIHSPPRTPHNPNVLSQPHYHSFNPLSSMSTTSYEGYSQPISNGPMLNDLWVETTVNPASMSVPEILMPKPIHIFPITQQSHSSAWSMYSNWGRLESQVPANSAMSGSKT